MRSVRPRLPADPWNRRPTRGHSTAMPDLLRVVLRCAFAASFGLAVSVACHDEDVENAGMPCDMPSECYPEVADEDLAALGELVCLDRVPGGYCTHLCTTDADC